MENVLIIEESNARESDVKGFGFWIYLMTDLVIFSALFAVFLVMHDSTAGGPSGAELFSLPVAIAETFILLTSSFTCALGMVSIHRELKKPALFWFGVTFLLGVSFLYLEISEFSKFFHKGASWERSAFLSSYFTLVGTHGLHISIGLLWILVALFYIDRRPLSVTTVSKVSRMALFWHFLDFVWIFIFTIVYGLGYLS